MAVVPGFEQLGSPFSSDKLVASYIKLQQVHWAFGIAEQELVNSRGAPICISGCGICCEVNTPSAWEVEAHYAVSTLLGAGKLQRVAQLAEGWLLERSAKVTTYGLKGRVSGEAWKSLWGEVKALLQEPCPFLTSDKECVLWDVRPLVCRAYGVTRLPGMECRRPYGIGERPTFGDVPGVRVVYQGQGSQVINSLISTMLDNLPEPGLRMAGFFPTQLMRLIDANKLQGLADSGQVASVKLAQMPFFPGILMLEQQEIAMGRRPTTERMLTLINN